MTTNADQQNPTDAAAARKVEETGHLAAGLTEPADPGVHEVLADQDGPAATLGGLQLSMFAQGESVRVRVGNPLDSANLFEQVYDSADAANEAMLDGGILTAAQVPDPAAPAGIGIALTELTAQQLLDAGLKRHGSATYGGKQ